MSLILYGALFMQWITHNSCYDSAPVLNVLFIVYMVMGVLYAFLPLLFCCMLCCCANQILRIWARHFIPPGQEAINDNVLKNLPRKKYIKDDPEMQYREDCCICKCDYEEGEELIVLKCDKSHYFHEQCLSEWLKINKVCPMCRAEVK